MNPGPRPAFAAGTYQVGPYSEDALLLAGDVSHVPRWVKGLKEARGRKMELHLKDTEQPMSFV